MGEICGIRNQKLVPGPYLMLVNETLWEIRYCKNPQKM